MKRFFKKIKYGLTVFRWFIVYSLMHGEFGRVWHLIKSLSKHFIFKTPYAVFIESSNTCNFRCPTCPTPHKLIHRHRKPEYIDFEKYKKIIDNIKDYVHNVYVYNTNEPLLHPKISEMISYASSKNLHTMISTNCSLLNKDMTEKLLKSRLGEIRFAFDGLSAESFEGFRVGGDFEKVKENIEYFCKRKKELNSKLPVVTLQFILNKLNQDEIEQIKEFSRKNNIDKLYIKPFILSEYAYSQDEIKDLSEKFYPDKDIYDDAVVYVKNEHGLQPKIEHKTCVAVNRVFHVLADGRATMCCFDIKGEYVYGQMDQVPLKELWNSSRVKKFRNFGYNRQTPLCKKCGNVE